MILVLAAAAEDTGADLIIMGSSRTGAGIGMVPITYAFHWMRKQAAEVLTCLLEIAPVGLYFATHSLVSPNNHH
jgi:hypothetical protein